jgi:NTE family protein
MGLLFNVMFLDHLTADIEHLERLNETVASDEVSQSSAEAPERMRPLTSLIMTPSVDLGKWAEQHQGDMPYLTRYFVNGLARDAASSSDLLSALLFTSKYTSDLIEIGYHDTSLRIDEIEQR